MPGAKGGGGGGAVMSKVEFYCNDAYNIFMPKMATLTMTNSTFAIPMLSTHCASLVSCTSSLLHTSNHVPLTVIQHIPNGTKVLS